MHITDRPRLETLVGPLAGAINGLIETGVRTFLESDAFEEFWITANTRPQQALVRLLDGRRPGDHGCAACGWPGRGARPLGLGQRRLAGKVLTRRG